MVPNVLALIHTQITHSDLISKLCFWINLDP